jgi:biopolymer transport protein ExbB
MLDWIILGGPVMGIILLLSLLAVTLFLERLFHLRRAYINSADFLEGIYNVLRRRNVVEAVSICEETPGPVAHLTRAAILQGDRSPSEIQHAIESAGLAEVPRLERNLNLLATIAHITPMLGLLGTVLAMMDFLLLAQGQAPLVYAGDVAGSMWKALLTTAAGLTVSIPAFAAYNYLVQLVETIVLDMERASVEVLNFLSQPAIPVEVSDQ